VDKCHPFAAVMKSITWCLCLGVSLEAKFRQANQSSLGYVPLHTDFRGLVKFKSALLYRA
jgi:hypothetical protein